MLVELLKLNNFIVILKVLCSPFCPQFGQPEIIIYSISNCSWPFTFAMKAYPPDGNCVSAEIVVRFLFVFCWMPYLNQCGILYSQVIFWTYFSGTATGTIISTMTTTRAMMRTFRSENVSNAYLHLQQYSTFFKN